MIDRRVSFVLYAWQPNNRKIVVKSAYYNEQIYEIFYQNTHPHITQASAIAIHPYSSYQHALTVKHHY